MPELALPFAVFYAGALVLAFLPRGARPWAFLIPPLAVLWILWGLEEGIGFSYNFLDWQLTVLRVDRLSLLFGWVFTIAAFVGGVYALHVKDTTQQVAALLYAGSGLGAVFAGDLLTLFIFWEMMAVASTGLILARRTPRSLAAGMRYIYVHLGGGLFLLAGIILHVTDTGSLTFEALEAHTAASWLILIGFALNAAVPPLHAWLADAYPAATVTGAVFLSAFTTKTAVYALARGFAGWEILVLFGVGMTLYGVIYALLVDDIRRLLSYHIVSQVGFMVAGIGLGTELALNGATSHAFTHILYKGLLFMGAGVVLYTTGRVRQSELGVGLWRLMPWTVALYMIGAFSISGVPLFSGFVSKSITIDAAGVINRDNVVLLLHLASIGTFLSIALKLPYLTWGGAPQAIDHRSVPWNMVAAMAIMAGLNVALGIFPASLYALLPYEMTYEPYTVPHVLKAVQLLGFAFLAFWFMRDRLRKRTPVIALDTDWFLRRPARWSYFQGPRLIANQFGAMERLVNRLVSSLVTVGSDPIGWSARLGRGGPLSPEAKVSTDHRIPFDVGVMLMLLTILTIFLLLII